MRAVTSVLLALVWSVGAVAQVQCPYQGCQPDFGRSTPVYRQSPTRPRHPPSSTAYRHPPPSRASHYPPPSTAYHYPSPSTAYRYPPPTTVFRYPPPTTVYGYPPPTTTYRHPPQSYYEVVPPGFGGYTNNSLSSVTPSGSGGPASGTPSSAGANPLICQTTHYTCSAQNHGPCYCMFNNYIEAGNTTE
jgi:hypothetical protein